MKRKWKWSEIKQKIKFKSPAAMLALLFAGLVTVLGCFGPLMWEQWTHIEQLKTEQSALELYIADGQQKLDAEEPHPMTPLDKDTLIRLQEQLPTGEEVPRFIVQLAAASNAGITLNGLHVARSEEKLNERMADPGLLSEEETSKREATEKEETGESPEQDTSDEEKAVERSELLQFDPGAAFEETGVTDGTETGLQKLWVDVYLQGTYANLADFFSQLKQQSRLTEVVEWRYVLPQEENPSNIRLRLNVLYYADEKLTDLPPWPEPDIPESGGPPIDVLPEEPPPTEEEEESHTLEREDIPFFIPYPFVPNEDGTGFVPYPWEPGDEFPWEEGGNDPSQNDEPSTDTGMPVEGSLIPPDPGSMQNGMRENDKSTVDEDQDD